MNSLKRLKKIMYFMLIVLSIVLVVCLIIFISDVMNNKGLVPFMFIFLALFYTCYEISNFEIMWADNVKRRKRRRFNFMKLLNFFLIIISSIFAILSIYIFWL